MSGLIGKASAHESAVLHVNGSAIYTDDIPEIEGTLHAAFALSACAHGLLKSLDLKAARAAPGVRAVLSAADIPGRNECGPSSPQDPLFVSDLVEFYGQALCLVVADSQTQARKAASLVRVEYEVLPAIITIEEAVAAESWILPPVELRRGDAVAALKASPRRLKGHARVGGQEHFYLEGQVAYAVPGEQETMHVRSSTQHPTEMQHLVAGVLSWPVHRVSVECRRMGGGFGGKETQSAQVACAAALAAWKLGRPVKVRLDRDDDMMMSGKRHDFTFDYEVGFDEKGLIRGLSVTMASRCGYSADLSGPINDRAIFHIDNCYYLPDVFIRSLRCKTNTQSNTAFRGFGGPQGMFGIESIIDDIAAELGRDPLDVRKVNFYGPSSGSERVTTPYGMKVEDNVAPDIVEKLATSCDYEGRRAAIRAFNESSPVIKKGLALTPVKFGISFTATFYNQAGALVYVYTDGSVLVSHGGTEMGQGLYTKIRQIVAHEFGLGLDAVRFTSTDTSRVPNTSATAASSGTDLNGKAAQIAAQAIKTRLAEFFALQLGLDPGQAGEVRFENGKLKVGGNEKAFAKLVDEAYHARIKLWESGYYRTPKIHYDAKTMQGRPFFYFSYGAACSEVAVDTLTGEYKVTRVDILHDAGKSINPAIDLGQIEGGFIQGMGWLTTEELWWQPPGAQTGRLMTHAPSTYKIPASGDCPPVFNVAFYENSNVEDTIHRSKAVGEPPLMLALSVFFALKDAAREARSAILSAQGVPSREAAPRRHVSLPAPATPEALLRAIHFGE